MASPLEYSISCEDVGAAGVSGDRKLDKQACQNLAARFDLVEVISASYQFSVLRTLAPPGYRLKGQIVAHVIQRCARSFEPVKIDIDEKFDVYCFVEREELSTILDEDAADWDEDDVEMINNAAINVGEIAAQYLGLAIDPYLTGTTGGLEAETPHGIEVLTEEEAKRRASPFSVLKNLTDKA